MPELKGYPVPNGYIGILKDGSKKFYPVESEYEEEMREEETEV